MTNDPPGPWQRAKVALRSPQAAIVRYRRRLRPGHHYLSICAIFKDEAPFLREWISFHRGVGVEHFFLYNNNSSDHFRDVLAEFDCVTLIEWPLTKWQQRAAYLHCLDAFGGRSRWIAFIDIDEFLFVPDTVDVRPTLCKFEHAPGVLVTSATYGTSGHQSIPPSVIDAFTMRSATTFSGKTVADPRLVRDIRNAHAFHYYGPVPGARPPMDAIRINHYIVRSFDDMAAKVMRGDVWGDCPKDLDKHRQADATLNQVHDPILVPIARSLVGQALQHDTRAMWLSVAK
jgi:hypothetical protein